MRPATRVREAVRDKSWPRIVGGLLILAVVIPMLLTVMSPAAMADGKTCEGDDADDACKDYSLYTLASNASSYFGNANSPEEGDVHKNWNDVRKYPGRAGSLVGYSDPKFSFSFKWLFSEVSGSSQTIEYSSFANKGEDDNLNSGVIDYAHYGAALNDLGFDSTQGSADVIAVIIHGIGGFLIFLFYALAIGIGWIMTGFIKLLKLLNPFSWFYYGVEAISPTWADGMVNGNTDMGAFEGLANFVSGWYGALQDMSANVLIPFFLIAFVIGIVLFKKGNTGSRLKKLIIRTIFIFVGLPLIGSMYTQVLDTMDTNDSQSAGASQVVLSTYVDFNAWSMNSRLAIPDDAVISWDAGEGRAGSVATMNTRTSAQAINASSNKAFKNLGPATGGDPSDPGGSPSDWTDSSPDLTTTCGEDQTPEDDGCVEAESGSEVGSVMGLLLRYMGSQSVNASDFESGIKDAVLDVDSDDKAKWFGQDGGDYENSEKFGEGDDPVAPVDHPIISTNGVGLDSDASGSQKLKTFTTNADTKIDCGFQVADEDGNALNCNMSPLAQFNYLNTSFESNSLTAYSSNKAMSDISRQSHMSVNQVGTGPMSFAYWFNAIIILVCVVLLGFFYAFGMLFGAMKRTFMLVTAIPFATMGAMSGIAKVIIYTIALIVEVIGTLFLYNFVSQVLISLPSIIEGPVAQFMKWQPIETALDHDDTGLIGTVVVLFTVILSTLLILVGTIAMLNVRSSVIKAINEQVTKLVDKFLETETAPSQDSGIIPAMAGGAGVGAGMALGNRMLGGKGGGSSATSSQKGQKDTSSHNSAPTNTGGTNGELEGSGSAFGELTGGSGDPNDPNGSLQIGPGDGGSELTSTSRHGLPPGGSAGGASDGGEVLEGTVVEGSGSDVNGESGLGGNGQGGLDGIDGEAQERSGDGTVDGKSSDAGAIHQVAPDGTVTSSADDQQLADQVAANGGLTNSTTPDGPGTVRELESGARSSNLGGTNDPSVDVQVDGGEGSKSMGTVGTLSRELTVAESSGGKLPAPAAAEKPAAAPSPILLPSQGGQSGPSQPIIVEGTTASQPVQPSGGSVPTHTSPGQLNRAPASPAPQAPVSSPRGQAPVSTPGVPIVVRGGGNGGGSSSAPRQPAPQAPPVPVRQPAVPVSVPGAGQQTNVHTTNSTTVVNNNSTTTNSSQTTNNSVVRPRKDPSAPRRGRRDKRD